MAKEDENLSPEEKAKKAEEARALNVKKTLETKLFQNTVGTNFVLTNQSVYGSSGVASAQSLYDSTMTSDEAKKERDNMYRVEVTEYRKRGVFGDPAMPSNGDLSNKLIKQLNEVMAIARLGELEAQVKALTKGTPYELKSELPEELKKYLNSDLQIKLAQNADGDGNVDPIKVLDKNELVAFRAYGTLTKAYKMACAKKVADVGYFAEVNEELKEIADAYKPKEELREVA
jgi:hypothetical protein